MELKLKFASLQKRLAKLGFTNWECIVEEDVYKGSPYVYCLFIRFILVVYPEKSRAFLQTYPFFIIEEDDAKLASSVLRLLRLEYNYTSPITAVQFMRRQFASAKISICLFLLDSLEEKKELTFPRQTRPRVKAITMERPEQLIQDRREALNAIPRS
ncbi:hypothetical protein AGDE_00434 [Angomonas deanei]|uniref:Centrosomal spindle body, CEP44, putative n=1 Tax=Angomonas deanei TaxID=59799 RepID=S9VL01_9TRYP|nr:hypothetical protein AGDE_04917 [Angomonas deanei]EPY43487.1 hypothetical protein AGDE_00434 [Angomonas deanei]CAD2217130.1 Centrosomal spindle body, CEP44, putative [Angomonas deanei]|eukprot:EPY39012.1 hypothetical protein AGDE_04917 [Angomonas deanei]